MKLLSSLAICFPLYVQGEDRRTGGYRETKSYRQYRSAQNYCDHKQPCSLSSPGQPVCNFDFGDHGFCEECPGHCLKTGYNNEIMAVPICCDVCRYGEQEGCGDNVRRPQMTAGVAQYRPSTFQKFLNQASRNIKWGTRKAVKAYQGTELSNEVNQAVAGIVDPKVKKLQDAQKELFEIKNSDKSPEEKVNEVKQVLQSVGINAPFDLEDVKKDVGRKLSRKTGLGEYEREQVKSHSVKKTVKIFNIFKNTKCMHWRGRGILCFLICSRFRSFFHTVNRFSRVQSGLNFFEK